MPTTRTDGIALLSMGLLFLILPGMLYNNLNNSGLANVNTAMTCDLTLDTCVLNTAVGCQVAPANCNLSGKTISFFNTNSPFTQLLQGNLFALFTNLNPLASSGGTGTAAQTSWSGTHGPFDITGNPIYYSADCQGTTPGGGSRTQTQWLVGRCTQTGTDSKNVTQANAAKWNNWNTDWNTTLALQFYQLGNATFARSCSWLNQINYTALTNGPGYTYFGCDIAQGTIQSPNSVQPTHRAWSILVAMPGSYGIMPSGTSHQLLFVQLESWETQQCLTNTNLKYANSQQCNNYLAGFKGVSIPNGGSNSGSSTFVPNSAGAIVFGFLAGIILLIGGLGLQVGVGGGVSAGTNPQGTKLFQALGLGLILWGFFSSQFATWYTSGILPAGLDGLTGIIGLAIDALIFAGTYFMVVKGGGGTTVE